MEFERILPRNIEDEMKNSYIDYSMSVIVGRALPDVRDGLKPVHRRILYTMDEMGLAHSKPYRKSARVVGDVLGKYHPHGDTAVYDALVRMVQDFSLRIPLVDGQGNFGSIDGDPPAAMRYTEVRLQTVAQEVLGDIEKETVDFTPNYDGSLQEPVVLPAKLPNLLVNGSSGIAVGMATNIPPHNLSEVCDALIAYIDNPEITTTDILKLVKGPDFPTAGIIMGKNGIKDYFETGRGSIKIRAQAEIEDIKSGRQAIIIHELPYQVNKATLQETIAALVRDKKITDISDIRDESSREGIRVVIEIKRDGNANIVLNQLFKLTQMEVSFGVIMLAIVDGRPRVLPFKEVLRQYVRHREIVIVRKTKFELKKAEDRAHILEGLKIAIDNLNKIVKIIRESKDVDEARARLMEEFALSKIQSQAILDMRLHQLTGLERKKIEDEYLELIKTIARLKGILADPKKILEIIKADLKELKEKYGDERRTKITAQTGQFEIEDLIEDENVVVTFSHAGYVKRIPLDTYRSQKRGGKGVTAMATKEDDFVEQLFVTNTHAYLLLFTNRGRLYWLRVYEIPDASRTARGKAIVNFVQLGPEEKITSSIPIDTFEEKKGEETYLLMCTRNGTIKRTPLSEYDNIRTSGVFAIGLDEGNVLVDVKHTDGKQQVLIGTKLGKAIRFDESEIRVIGRSGKGVRGIRLDSDDQVIGMEVAPSTSKASLLTVCENGYGKRTDLTEYRDQSRGGKGVITIKTSDRNGSVLGIKLVTNENDVMIMTVQGIAIRLPCKDIRLISRNTQGVRLVRLEEGDKIANVASVVKEDENEEEKKEKE
ncbi:MAG: DNA gyrase subunit A [Elusimicrobia bacterium RIFCSPLOWO2_02_FULL_39_32]|nr:MAG: DNA gyrase subunit A [Elusimicrobia bacterium RIFCSPHIGHO2_02_FULL_39_36]OGR92433.1 MAG: DNA gyrase subunit A [Elusimicrobia bacterium RIFCSPLOWO2_02_FULL_39_32]OGR98969.1 MAG: DNA gyrase subunit A [Elusimicrobia bacterium RIFCSPLOWO2_12_FULL_39_28]